MGGSKNYLEDGGFTNYNYYQSGTTANGIKIISKNDNPNPNIPLYSNTPFSSYAIISPETTLVKQVSTYGGKDGRNILKDIDTEHAHANQANGKIVKVFDANDIHVHEYIDGKRSKNARKPSKKERRLLMIARYGR